METSIQQQHFTFREQEISTVRNNSSTQFPKPTILQFEALQSSFDYYNNNLFIPVFNQLLPPVIFSLNDNSRRTSKGYYSFDKYKDDAGNVFSLINITPEYLNNPFITVMGTLVHEMCHHYQYLFGKKAGQKRSYHDLEFASIMECTGLICSCTGKEGGKKTGYKMTHYILEGGIFESLTLLAPDSLKTPFVLNAPRGIRELKTPQEHSKTKICYQCSVCQNKVWGKPNLQISCVPCGKLMLSPDQHANLTNSTLKKESKDQPFSIFEKIQLSALPQLKSNP